MVEPAGKAELAPSLASRAGYLLYRAFQVVQQTYLATLDGQPHPRELTLLARLLAEGPIPQHELAQSLSVNRSVMVHIVDDLERAGLATRERNPDDRRSHLIAATAAGAAALRAAAPAIEDADARLAGNLTAAAQRRLRELLATLLGPGLPATVPPVSDTVGYRIARAHFALRARADTALDPLGIDVRQFGVLSTVRDVGPCSQQRLATLLDVSGPVIVELIDALEARKLVARERNPADRRSYALRLTRAGEAMLARAGAAITKVEADITERLSGERLDELCALLRTLLGA